MLNDSENLGNFDARSDERVFLGYSSNSRIYWFYNMQIKQVLELIYRCRVLR